MSTNEVGFQSYSSSSGRAKIVRPFSVRLQARVGFPEDNLPLFIAPELLWLTVMLVVVFDPLGPATVMTASLALWFVTVTRVSSLSEESDELSPVNGELRI